MTGVCPKCGKDYNTRHKPKRCGVRRIHVRSMSPQDRIKSGCPNRGITIKKFR